ncbi:MAG TPA: glycosyltransferase [Pirellulales bacterium]|nr:glycosyltransferase [Pirellulales bacterium]
MSVNSHNIDRATRPGGRRPGLRARVRQLRDSLLPLGSPRRERVKHLRDVLLHGWWKYRQGTASSRANREVLSVMESPVSQLSGSSLRLVLFFAGGGTGESFRYRVQNVIAGLHGEGVLGKVFDSSHPIELDILGLADLIVVFRSIKTPALAEVLAEARRLKIPVVFDVDDLVFEPESIHHVDGIRGYSPEQVAEYRRGVCGYREMLLEADAATCTTSFLKERIERLGKPAHVIPNTINDEQLAVARQWPATKAESPRTRIGYFSGSATHNKDFLEAAGAVARVMRERPEVEFLIVGPLELPADFAGFESRIIRKRFMSPLDMLRELATVDINIAPLELDNPFTAGKSELKIFEAALVGVPTVASATDSYGQCITHGKDGFVAATPAEWFAALDRLVADRKLRIEMGRAATARFVPRFSIHSCAAAIVDVYHTIIEAANDGPCDLNCLDIAWIVPQPSAGSGGHRNIYRAAKKLSEFGHRVTLYHTETQDDSTKEFVCQNFYDLSEVDFVRYRGTTGRHDVCFATHWSTAYCLQANRHRVRHPFYFVQDFEPMFYPMGSEYILAENTYRLGFTHVTSGPWPKTVLEREYSRDAHEFYFPIDTSIYGPGTRTVRHRRVLFFARPEWNRRCYELGIAMLAQFARRNPDVEIVLYGSSKIESETVPFPHANLQMLPSLQALAELYRNADLGIVFSTTNPSLVPYEMMACGLAVADIGRDAAAVNYGGEENIFLLNPSPDLMAREVQQILADDVERARRAANGMAYVQGFPDEVGMARRIEEIVRQTIRKAHRRAKLAAHGPIGPPGKIIRDAAA